MMLAASRGGTAFWMAAGRPGRGDPWWRDERSAATGRWLRASVAAR